MESLTSQSTIADNQAEVLLELEKIQLETVTWQSQIKTLGLSLLAFIAVAWILTVLFDNDFTDLLIVIIMLFVHEAGHYIGMRQFGYRNLRMFFIPLFGAAVNGYACVPVTKESIVYLLGPVPGIVLGSMFGVFYFLTRQSVWLEAAKIFITINTINLLPLYPLDGGQFVFGILPRKTHKLQWLLHIVFIIATVIVLWQFSASIVGGLIGLVLLRTWHLHKYNKIASTLLTQGIVDPQTADEIIPPEMAPKIIAIVQDETGFTKPKEVAGVTWTVWTRAKAKRPTSRELVYLWTIYVGVLALGTVMCFVYFA
jgi:Zn-dependent protease